MLLINKGCIYYFCAAYMYSQEISFRQVSNIMESKYGIISDGIIFADDNYTYSVKYNDEGDVIKGQKHCRWRHLNYISIATADAEIEGISLNTACIVKINQKHMKLDLFHEIVKKASSLISDGYIMPALFKINNFSSVLGFRITSLKSSLERIIRDNNESFILYIPDEMEYGERAKISFGSALQAYNIKKDNEYLAPRLIESKVNESIFYYEEPKIKRTIFRNQYSIPRTRETNHLEALRGAIAGINREPTPTIDVEEIDANEDLLDDEIPTPEQTEGMRRNFIYRAEQEMTMTGLANQRTTARAFHTFVPNTTIAADGITIAVGEGDEE